MQMDFDAVLEKCGSFGRFQYIVLLCFGIVNILSSMHYYSQILITFTPEHWCYHEKLANASFDEIRAIYSQTQSPHCTLLDDIVDGKPVVAEVGQCQQWIYEYERGYRTITTELNWVCDDAFQSAVGQSLYFVGSVTGTMFFGFLADKVGRLPAMLCSTLSGALGDFLTSFANNLPTFALFRFVSGLSTDTLFYLMYIMVFEYLSPQKRTLGLNLITGVFYFTGLVFTPWFALWSGSWRLYLYIASVPALIVLVFPFLICESAQWLITTQRYERAVKCLKRVAKINKREVKDEVFEEFVAYYQKKAGDERKLVATKDTFWGMFRTPRLRKFTIIMVLKDMIISLALDVISRNMEGMGISPFVLFSATSVVYIFSGCSLILLQNRIGRKGMAFSTLLLSAVIVATTGFLIIALDTEQHAITLAIMVGLGRYGVVVSYEAEAQYASEFIPTSVRGRAMANIHVAGFGFTSLSSYVIYLGHFFKPLPSICISILLLLGAILCLALPETLNQKLPQTLKDGEEFARHQRWYYFPCFDRKQQQQKEAEISN
ncbi:organic cation transporter-like protein [Bactrocera neohumeralis]|uniref:organic cation transporter-like protein n=1 Tax=Bactrocera neohumeralis TaxID=98809 RepID=UPI00216677B8|nr:organic cation transporter-like protein [Bactrocera neohumeralis]XP_050316697.1 organic cation transporter-like protein [Bactrocera neohumeralis]